VKTLPLSDLVSAAGRRAGDAVDLPVYSVTKYAGFVRSLEYFKKQVFSRDVRGYKVVEPGDFAYATIHLDEGSIGIAPERGLISPMYTVFRADTSLVDANYLLRFLKSPRALAEYTRLGKGAVHRRKAISLPTLGALAVPLPSLTEQRRIATILDRGEALGAKRRQVLAHLDSLTRAIFQDMFGSRQDPVHRLDDLVAQGDRMNYGVVQPGQDVAGGIPLIRVSNLRGGVVDRSELKRIAPDVESSYRRSRIKGNEILISSVGSIGLVSVASQQDVGSNVARAITRVPISDPVRRAYVAAYLRTEAPQRYFVSELRTVAQPTLNVRQLAATEVPLPPAELQEKFLVRTALVEAQQSRVRLRMCLEDQLFTSLQSRAFRGNL
jgi:type I restriction enzyme S subunit